MASIPLEARLEARIDRLESLDAIRQLPARYALCLIPYLLETVTYALCRGATCEWLDPGLGQVGYARPCCLLR